MASGVPRSFQAVPMPVLHARSNAVPLPSRMRTQASSGAGSSSTSGAAPKGA